MRNAGTLFENPGMKLGKLKPKRNSFCPRMSKTTRRASVSA